MVSAVLLVAALAGVAAVGGTLLSGPIGDMVSHAPEIAGKVRARLDDLTRPLAVLSEAGSLATSPDGAQQKDTVSVAGSQNNFLNWLLGTLADVGSIIASTLLLALFLLASTDTLKLKLVRAFPQLKDKKRSLHVLHEIETRISRYLVTVSVINFSLGTLIGLAMWALGMPYPILWGVGAALLNYVPYAGPFTGIALAAAVSLTIHDDLLATAVPPLAYAALNSIEGTFVTPMIVGRRLSLSIIAILMTIGLATWMWGIIGTIIAVPLLVVIKAFCDEFPSLAQIGMFISAEGEPVEEQEGDALATTNGSVPAGAAMAAPAAAPRADVSAVGRERVLPRRVLGGREGVRSPVPDLPRRADRARWRPQSQRGSGLARRRGRLQGVLLDWRAGARGTPPGGRIAGTTGRQPASRHRY